MVVVSPLRFDLRQSETSTLLYQTRQTFNYSTYHGHHAAYLYPLYPRLRRGGRGNAQ